MRNPANETELNQLENVLVTQLDVLDVASIQEVFNEGVQNLVVLTYCYNAGYGAYDHWKHLVEIKFLDTQYQCYRPLDVTKIVLPILDKTKRCYYQYFN
jgi:hypothetical protein